MSPLRLPRSKILLTAGMCALLLLARLFGEAAAQEGPAGPPERLSGHTAPLNVALYTPDGEKVVTAASDNTIRIWEAATGREIRTLEGHTGQVLSVAVSPDGRSLVSGGQDNTLKLWDIPQPQPLKIFAGAETPLRRLAASPDGRSIAAVGDDLAVRIWTKEDGKPAGEWQGHTAGGTAITYRTDGNMIASGDKAGDVILWDTFDGSLLARLGAHRGRVTAAHFHPNNQQLYTSGEDGLIKWWQLPVLPPRQLAGHGAAVRGVAISSNGQFAATAGDDKRVRLFNPADGALLRELEEGPENLICVAFSPNVTLVAAGDAAGSVQLWNPADGAGRQSLLGHSGSVQQIAFHPDNQRLATAGADGTVRLWSLPQPPVLLAGHTMPARTVAISPNGQMVATGSDDHLVRLYNRENGQPLRQLEGHAAEVTCLAFRADGGLLASGDKSGLVRLVNPADGTLLGEIGAHAGPVTSISIHPAGEQMLTTGADGLARLWTLPTVLPKPLPGHGGEVSRVALSGDAQVVVTGADDGVRVFDGSTGQSVRSLEGPPLPVRGLAMSSDAALIAAAGESGTIKLWNAADGTDRGSLVGHAGPVGGLAFHPEGTRLASAGADGTIRVWRLPTPPLALAGHTQPVLAVDAAAGGKWWISGSADKTLRVYNPADGGLIRAIEGHLEPVTAVTASPDGAAIAAGEAGGGLRLWNAADGASLAELLGHAGPVTAIAWTSDSKFLITAGEDGSVRWWQTDTPPPRLLPGGEAVHAVAATADGKIIYSAGDDQHIHVFRGDDGSELRKLEGHAAAINALALSADESMAASGDAGGEIRLWQTADGAFIGRLAGHVGAVHDLTFSKEGDRVASAGADGTVRVWTLPAPPQPLIAEKSPALAYAMSADGKLLAAATVAGDRPAIVIRSIPDGKQKATLLGHEGPILALAFSNDGKRLASGSADKTARVWDLNDAKFPETCRFSGHEAAVSAVAFSGDGLQVFSGGADNAVRQFSAVDGGEVRAIAGHSGAVTSLVTRGTSLFSASADGTVRVWNIADGAAIRTINHAAAVRQLAVSAEGQWLASGGEDGSIKLWKAADGESLATLSGLSAPVAALSIGPGGERVSGAAGGEIITWNSAGVLLERRELPDTALIAAWLREGGDLLAASADGGVSIVEPSLERLLTGHEGAVQGVAFLPDGESLISGGADKTVRQWDLTDGKQAREFNGPGDAVTSLAVSADGRRLAAGSLDKTTHVWNLDDQSATATLAQPAPVRSVSFGGDGGTVLTAGEDGLIRLWDLASGRERERYQMHEGAVHSALLCADGKQIVSGGADKTVAVATPSCARVVAVGETKISDMALSTDDERLAVVDGADTVHLFDAETGAAIGDLAGAAGPLTTVALRPGEVAAGGADQDICIWQLGEGAPAGPKRIAVGAAAVRIRYSPDGSRLAEGCADNHIRTFDSATGILLEDIVSPAPATVLAWSSDGLSLLTAAANDGLAHRLSLLSVIARHEGEATDVAYTPDGKRLVSAGADKTIRLCSADDGTPLATFAPAEGAVTSLAVTADGRQLITGSADKLVRVFPLPSPDSAPAAEPALALATYDHGSPVQGVSAGGEGGVILSGGDDGVIRAWDAGAGRELERFAGHDGAVHDVALAGDGKTLVSAGADKSARVWTVAASRVVQVSEGNVAAGAFVAGDGSWVAAGDGTAIYDQQGNELRKLAGAKAGLRCLAVRPDAAELLAADAEGRLYRWTLADGALVQTVETGRAIHGVGFALDSSQAVFAFDNGSTSVYDAELTRVLQAFVSPAPATAATIAPGGGAVVIAAADNSVALHPLNLLRIFATDAKAIRGVAFSPDGNSLIAGASDGTIKRFNIADGSLIASYGGLENPVTCLAVTPNSQQLIGGAGNVLQAWPLNPEGGVDPIAPVEPLHSFPHDAAVLSLSISADSAKGVAADAAGMVRVWDLASGRELEHFAAHDGEAAAVAIAPDNKTILSGGADMQARLQSISAVRLLAAHDGPVRDMALAPNGGQLLTAGQDMLVKLLNTGDGSLIRELPGAAAVPLRVAFRPDQQQVAAACENGVILRWNPANGAVELPIEAGSAPSALSFSPDNQRLVAAAERRLLIYSTADGALLQELASAASVLDARFSADSRHFYSAEDDGAVKQWLFASPAAVRTFSGHGGPVYRAAFTPDGKQIVSASGDQTLRVWDAEQGNQIRQLAGHQGPVYGLDMSGDGALLVSGGADNTVRLWDLAGGRQLKQISAGDAALYAVAFHADGKRVVAAGMDKKIRVFDAFTGAEQLVIEGHDDYIHHVAFNAKGDKLLSVGYGGSLFVWNLADGKKLFEHKLGAVANYADFSPAGDRLIVAGGDGFAHFVDVPPAAK